MCVLVKSVSICVHIVNYLFRYMRKQLNVDLEGSMQIILICLNVHVKRILISRRSAWKSKRILYGLIVTNFR